MCTHSYRGISANQTPPPNRYSSLATLSTKQNQKKAKHERQRARDERENGKRLREEMVVWKEDVSVNK